MGRALRRSSAIRLGSSSISPAKSGQHVRRWLFVIKRCDLRTASYAKRWTNLRPGFWPWVSNQAIASEFGRQTTWSGYLLNLPLRKLASSSSISTRHTGYPNSNTRLTKSAAKRSSSPSASRHRNMSACCASLRRSSPKLFRVHCASKRLPSLRTVVVLGQSQHAGTFRFADVLTQGEDAHRRRISELSQVLQFDEPINIQFTSGTTGAPKGATLSHHNILNNGFFIGEAMRLTMEDRLCIPVPLYHCFGMVLGNLAALTHGACMVFPGEGFDPLATLQAVAEERCTALHGVPTMFIAQLDHPDFARFDLSSLRTGIMAGSPCPIEVMKRAVSQMHLSEITIAYGMTETSPVSFQSSTSDPVDRRVSTVGRIQPHIEVKIVDPNGQIVPRGMSGELLTRGYSVMLGYWDDEARTRESIDAARWMHTGDLATIDDEGYCNIVGRIKDMIIRGGENVYPREIEEYLYKHPKIQDVQIFGVPDDHYGEEICAYIKLRPGVEATSQEIIEFCRGQIAHYKVPRYFKFVDQFPMTVTGKVQKFVMRDEAVVELGLKTVKTA